MNIQIRTEARRGCGVRKGGGLYLVAGKLSAPCGRLPLPLERCPTCDHGIKPSRGWTWVRPFELLAPKPCRTRPVDDCAVCPLADAALPERAGLLWIGEKFYPTPGEFIREAAAQGVSRRIHAIPRDFKVGETLVLMAHRRGILVLPIGPKATAAAPELDSLGQRWIPAIVCAYRPTAVEYVVKGDETEAKLQSMVDRGITLVQVLPAPEPEPAGYMDRALPVSDLT